MQSIYLMAPRLTSCPALLRRVHALLLLAVLPAFAEDGWSPAGKPRGVPLDARATESGYRAYRGVVTVCTDLTSLQQFVADASRLEEWIPHTEAARALPDHDGAQLYYMRTSAPWPFKPRDMVYRLTLEGEDDEGVIHIDLQGLPAALPVQDDAVRMRSADGQWTLIPGDDRIQVALRLAVDPGPAPVFFANRRLAATVAGTLSNLAAEFPCGGDP